MTSVRRKAVDVVVVGIGVAGTIVCKELAEAGLSVVGLERGRMVDATSEFAMPYAHDELKYERSNDYTQNLARETLTFRNTIAETALPMRELGSFKLGEGVGGAGTLWGGKTWRFLPWDFETRSRTIARYGKPHIPEGCTSQDWGLSYEDLEPYYDQFEHLYGIGGKAGNLNGELQPGGNPFEGPRSREYPNPPPAPNYAGALFIDAAKSLGYQPFPSPTAAMTQAYTNPYRLVLGACVSGGYCGGFTCAMGARATPHTTVLPALLKHQNFELRTHANVIRVNLDSEKKHAIGVTYIDARGNEIEQPAELVILTSYTFNNTRLMLLSGIGKPYDPVTNQGVVGRNYSYQCNGKVTLFFEDKTFTPFMGNGALGPAIDEYNGDNFDHSGLGFIGGASVCVNVQGALPIRYHPVPAGTPRWGSQWKQTLTHYYQRTMALSVSGGCQSYRTNYLDLDPTYRDAYGLPLIRMTFDYGENDRKMSAYVASKAAGIAQAMGCAKMNVTPVPDKYSIVPYQSTHNNGGAVMGDDPATSAVNPYLQSWDVPNVFVIGASAFPQNSAFNPTGTVGALTCRTVDAIKDQYLKRPGVLM